MIAKNDDLWFGTKRDEIFVLFDGEDGHSGNSFQGILFTESLILTQIELLECVHTFDGDLLFVIALEPDLPVWMEVGKIMQKRSGTFTVEVIGTNNVGNCIKGDRRAAEE